MLSLVILVKANSRYLYALFTHLLGKYLTFEASFGISISLFSFDIESGFVVPIYLQKKSLDFCLELNFWVKFK